MVSPLSNVYNAGYNNPNTDANAALWAQYTGSIYNASPYQQNAPLVATNYNDKYIAPKKNETAGLLIGLAGTAVTLIAAALLKGKMNAKNVKATAEAVNKKGNFFRRGIDKIKGIFGAIKQQKATKKAVSEALNQTKSESTLEEMAQQGIGSPKGRTTLIGYYRVLKSRVKEKVTLIKAKITKYKENKAKIEAKELEKSKFKAQKLEREIAIDAQAKKAQADLQNRLAKYKENKAKINAEIEAKINAENKAKIEAKELEKSKFKAQKLKREIAIDAQAKKAQTDLQNRLAKYKENKAKINAEIEAKELEKSKFRAQKLEREIAIDAQAKKAQTDLQNRLAMYKENKARSAVEYTKELAQQDAINNAQYANAIAERCTKSPIIIPKVPTFGQLISGEIRRLKSCISGLFTSNGAKATASVTPAPTVVTKQEPKLLTQGNHGSFKAYKDYEAYQAGLHTKMTQKAPVNQAPAVAKTPTAPTLVPKIETPAAQIPTKAPEPIRIRPLTQTPPPAAPAPVQTATPSIKAIPEKQKTIPFYKEAKKVAASAKRNVITADEIGRMTETQARNAFFTPIIHLREKFSYNSPQWNSLDKKFLKIFREVNDLENEIRLKYKNVPLAPDSPMAKFIQDIKLKAQKGATDLRAQVEQEYHKYRIDSNEYAKLCELSTSL